MHGEFVASSAASTRTNWPWLPDHGHRNPVWLAGCLPLRPSLRSRLSLRHMKNVTCKATRNPTSTINPIVKPAAAPGDIVPVPDASGSGTGPVVAIPMRLVDGLGNDLVVEAVAVGDVVVLDASPLPVDPVRMKNAGLARSGSATTNWPCVVGALNRRTYLVSLASCGDGASDVARLRRPSCARFTAPTLDCVNRFGSADGDLTLCTYWPNTMPRAWSRSPSL